VTEQVLYDQPLCPLSEAAQNAIIGEVPCIVPLFSPRTAAQFAKQVKDVRSTTAVVMSDAVARKLGDMAFIDMIKVQTPTGDEMARCVELWLLDASLA
jgi:uroporphyrinogen-III synthase